MVNRSVLIVKAKEPFRQWLLSLPEPDDAFLAEINEDNSVYLVPEYENDTEKDEILKLVYEEIFEEQLEDWWRDEKDWPKNRNLRLFKKWFDLEFHSVVIDLVGDELVTEQ
jgi:hypothetical protein